MGKYKNWEKAAFWSADTDEGMYKKKKASNPNLRPTLICSRAP